uniref:Uncharacterized protein n=1 Tax=Oryza barthii TaxID=65489 RepID=A0A0D3HSG1_9ORYZ
MGIFKDNGAQIFELAETFNGLNWEAINANNRELVILELIDGILSLLDGVPELSHPCIKVFATLLDASVVGSTPPRRIDMAHQVVVALDRSDAETQIKLVILKLINDILSLLDCIPELPQPCIKVFATLLDER